MKKRIKTKWLPHIIAAGAFAAFIALGLACATAPKGTDQKDNIEIFSSAEALKEHLDSQPGNSSDNPIKVIVAANDQTLRNIMDVIKSCNKYVNLSLDLSGNNQTQKSFSDVFSDVFKVSSDPAGDVLTKIEENAFKDCKWLISITIPSSVKKIDITAFFGLDNLTAINVNPNNQNFSSQNGILYNKDKTILIKYPSGKTGTFKLDAHRIFSYAFDGSNLSGITMIGGVVAWFGGTLEPSPMIMDNAFINCSKLTSVTFEHGAPYIIGKNFDGNFMDVLNKSRDNTDAAGTYTREIGSNTWKKQ
jgi:hypothetical protein